MERLISMILRRLLNKGINAGFKAASRHGQPRNGETQDPRQLPPQHRNSARGLRNATRLLRRFGKF